MFEGRGSDTARFFAASTMSKRDQSSATFEVLDTERQALITTYGNQPRSRRTSLPVVHFEKQTLANLRDRLIQPFLNNICRLHALL